MSYTPPPGGFNVPVQYAGQNPRPAPVTIASMLLYVTAVLLVLSTALSIFTITSISEAELIDAIMTDPAMTDDIAETTASVAVATVWISAILSLIIALVFVLCGLFVARGKQWARVTSWVFAGIAVLCCGAGSLVGLAAGGLTGGNASQDAMTEALSGDMPGWVSTINAGVLPVLWLLIGLAIIILLALPPSNGFFRKPEQQWTPPTYPSV